MKTWHQCGLDVTASKAKKNNNTQSLKKAGFSLANSIKPALEVDYGFINIVCSFWERTKAKTIWQTDEGRSLKNFKELLSVYLFMPAPSLFAGATRAGVIKEILCSHQSFGRQNRKKTVRDHMNSAANFNFRALVKSHAGYCARVSTPLSTQSALKVRIHPFTHTLAHTPPPLAEWTMQHQHADAFRREESWVAWGGAGG